MKLTPNGEFSGKVERQGDRVPLGNPFHGDRLFGRIVGSRDSDQKISGTYFPSAIAEPDIHRGFGGIRIEMNLVDPNGWGGTELDFSNHTVPDRLRVFDVGVGTADIELLTIIDAEKEIVFSWPDRGKIELVGGAQ